MEEIYSSTKKLGLLAESRGKDAFGLAYINDFGVNIYKDAIRAKNFFANKQSTAEIKEKIKLKSEQRLMFGHARMETDGNKFRSENNSPIQINDMIATHNGIAVNIEVLRRQFNDVKSYAEVDSEFLFQFIAQRPKTIKENLIELFGVIEGGHNFSIVDLKAKRVFLATNMGSIYYGVNTKRFVFASEKHMVDKSLYSYFGSSKDLSQKLNPGSILTWDLSLRTMHVESF